MHKWNKRLSNKSSERSQLTHLGQDDKGLTMFVHQWNPYSLYLSDHTTNHAIHWILISLVDNIISPLNNLGQVNRKWGGEGGVRWPSHGLIHYHPGHSRKGFYMPLDHSKKKEKEDCLLYGPLGLNSHLTYKLFPTQWISILFPCDFLCRDQLICSPVTL